MPFPFTWSGEVRIERPASGPALRPEQALDSLRSGLERARATSIRREGGHLDFRGGLLRFVSSRNLLVQVDRGSIDIFDESGGLRISYHLRYSQLFVATTLLVALLASATFADRSMSSLGRATVLGFAWSWLFGANFVISIVRFPRFIRRIVEAAR